MPCIHPPSNSTSRQSQHNHLPEPIYPHNMHSFATPHADSLVSQRFGQAQ